MPALTGRHGDAFARELGKALCDRLGLNHASTSVDYSVEPWGSRVIVRTSNAHFITQEDWAEVQAIAAQRAGVPEVLAGPVG